MLSVGTKLMSHSYMSMTMVAIIVQSHLLTHE